LARDAARHHRRVLVGHFFEMIDDAEVDVLRQEVLADALRDIGIDLVFVEDAGLFVLLEDRSVGINSPDLYLWIFLFEISADAGGRSASPDADDEVSDPAVGLLPDLGTRLLVVRLRVREVV